MVRPETHLERRSSFREISDVTIGCRVPASPILANIQNISAAGCKIVLRDRALGRGTTVILELPDKNQVVGQVVWASQKTAGIEFEHQISSDILATFVSAQGVKVEGNT